MQIVTGYSMCQTPDVVQVALNVLQLNAMMAQDDSGVQDRLLDAATDVLQEYLQQTGRFHPPPPPPEPTPQPLVIDTQQIANALQQLAERNCGR